MVSIPWQERYKHKLRSPQDALRQIKSGSRVYIGTACGEPQLLVAALKEFGARLLDTEVINMLSLGVAPGAESKFKYNFWCNSFFLGPRTRQLASEGQVDYTPVFLSEVPALFKSRQIPIDFALIQVSPPDEHGFCSYGVSVDVTKSAAESATTIIAEVNSNMPRTLGDSFIHVDDIDVLVESNTPLLEVKPEAPNEVSLQIAKNVAELVEDGATLQAGIGMIPEQILSYLGDRKDLGIHTELFSEGIINLIESGVITGRRKTLHKGKVVASFCIGTKRVYDFINSNPAFEFYPSDYTNDSSIISQNYKMTAINAALEVDLTGQVCADSLGYQFYSGIGGHVDFIRGAAHSEGGKPIIVLPSTTRDGTKSRIVPHLSEGAGVVTTRGDVHYVVTEYGVVYLHGKSIRERTTALINIAHPKFRQELLAAAKEHHYAYADQILSPESARYPKELETYKIFADNLNVFFRPVKPVDERAVQEFFYSLSDKSIYRRFFHPKKAFHHVAIQLWANIDYAKNMIIVGIAKDGEGSDKIIALGQYAITDESKKAAEVALAVADQYQNRGIGGFLLQHLACIAKEQGVARFTCEVLSENKVMLALLQKAGYKTVGSQDTYYEMSREL